MSDYGTRLAASANSGAESGAGRYLGGQDHSNYYVSHTASKALTYRPSPIAGPVAMVMDQVETMFLRKHEDYGPNNIALSPFGPMQGLLTRMHDKLARAVHLTEQEHSPNYEPYEDTFKDMIGYCIAAILVLRGEWPGVKPGQL